MSLDEFCPISGDCSQSRIPKLALVSVISSFKVISLQVFQLLSELKKLNKVLQVLQGFTLLLVRRNIYVIIITKEHCKAGANTISIYDSLFSVRINRIKEIKFYFAFLDYFLPMLILYGEAFE